MKAVEILQQQERFNTLKKIFKFLEVICPLQREKTKIYNRAMPKIIIYKDRMESSIIFTEEDEKCLALIDEQIEHIAKQYFGEVK